MQSLGLLRYYFNSALRHDVMTSSNVKSEVGSRVIFDSRNENATGVKKDFRYCILL